MVGPSQLLKPTSTHVLPHTLDANGMRKHRLHLK